MPSGCGASIRLASPAGPALAAAGRCCANPNSLPASNKAAPAVRPGFVASVRTRPFADRATSCGRRARSSRCAAQSGRQHGRQRRPAGDASRIDARNRSGSRPGPPWPCAARPAAAVNRSASRAADARFEGVVVNCLRDFTATVSAALKLFQVLKTLALVRRRRRGKILFNILVVAQFRRLSRRAPTLALFHE